MTYRNKIMHLSLLSSVFVHIFKLAVITFFLKKSDSDFLYSTYILITYVYIQCLYLVLDVFIKLNNSLNKFFKHLDNLETA